MQEESSEIKKLEMSLESQIEAVLFWKGEPMSIKELAKFFGLKSVEIETAISALENSLKTSGRGTTLVRNGAGDQQEVMLYTAPEASELIKRLTKEELSRDVSKAGVEVLSLILYRGPIAKREIDYIRGVNSGFILRNLMVRGLIERADTKDARSFIYQPTFELLSKLGVSKKEDLPDFAQVQKDIEAFVAKEEMETQKDAE
jgi:segregation and condensation protein B